MGDFTFQHFLFVFGVFWKKYFWEGLKRAISEMHPGLRRKWKETLSRLLRIFLTWKWRSYHRDLLPGTPCLDLPGLPPPPLLPGLLLLVSLVLAPALLLLVSLPVLVSPQVLLTKGHCLSVGEFLKKNNCQLKVFHNCKSGESLSDSPTWHTSKSMCVEEPE